MIVRTYGRRTRCGGGGGFSDAALLDDGTEADEPLPLSSQEPGGSQSDPYGFAAFSSQDSSPWSLDSDLFAPQELPSAPALPPLPRPPGNLSNGPPGAGDRKGGRGAKKPELPAGGRPGPAPRPPALPSAAPMTTLMETQEFGEMNFALDEVTFALDGLRAGQPARIRRASLLSLLTTCETAPRRRFLRAQGMSKRIIDAILDLSIDDSASGVAAGALFYVLSSDVPDDSLLDSPSCIHFLLKLLDPPAAESIEGKVPNIGRRLSGIGNAVTLNSMNKRADSSSTSIILKVQEILLSCKELKPSSGDDDAAGRPELSSKWIALLTLEKACLSTVSIEDTSGTVSRVGGKFKERLRELGGLDAIFNVAASCYLTMEGWLKNGFPSFREFKSVDLQSIILLLKCFKVMENATFLSKENQDHLLGMRTKVANEGLPLSFVSLVISAIKFLSDLSLHQIAPCISMKPSALSKDDCSCTSSADSGWRCNTKRSSYSQRSDSCQKRQRLSATEFEVSIADSKTTVAYDPNVSSSEARTDPCPLISCNGKLVVSRGRPMNAKAPNLNPTRGSNGWISIKISKSKLKSVSRSAEHCTTDGNEIKGTFLNGPSGDFSMNCTGSKMSSVHLRKRHLPTVGPKAECMGSTHDPFAFDVVDGNVPMSISAGPEEILNISEETRGKCAISANDPFAFDEGELGPSKWEMLASRKETSEKSPSIVFDCELENGPELLIGTNPESTKEENKDSDTYPSVAEEDPNLLEDCLLTAVKVLMNLTNDNPVGCQQIASCGGLDTLASLITGHFPSFDFLQPVHNQLDESISVSKSSPDVGPLKNKYLSDYELDFLVAILGLLVNLVEKDIQNRSRLASASVSMSHSGRQEDRGSRRDVISLLCSIFLANQGAGEVTGEGSLLSCDDEAALLQGEREAEMMIIEAYAALLLAFLSTESSRSWEAIASCLPDHSLEVLVPVLERFVAFHVSLNMISPETHSIVSEVIRSCKGS